MEYFSKPQRGLEISDGEGNAIEYPPGTIIKKVITTVTEMMITIGKNGEHYVALPLVKEEKMEYQVMTENPNGSNLGTREIEVEDVRYESDVDNVVQVRRNADKKYCTSFLPQESECSKYLKSYSSGNSHEKRNGRGEMFVTVDTLKIFGHVSRVQRGEKPYNIIIDYVHNSHGLGAHGTLQIRDIYGINFHTSKTAKEKSSNKYSNESNDFTLLLWCKTTLECVERLAAGGNSCVVFYDRLGRAFPKPVSQSQGKSRQVILLCSVSMGNMYKSSHGYDHWRKTMFPHGFDSVRGSGRFSPSRQENSIYRGWTVPCGQTKRNSRYPSYELDFNEYVVNNSKRIKVRFAIDIEITSKDSNDPE